jgi:hypothetical protein
MIRGLNNKKSLASDANADATSVTSPPLNTSILPFDIQKIEDDAGENEDDENDQFRRFSRVVLASLGRRLGSRKQAEALLRHSVRQRHRYHTTHNIRSVDVTLHSSKVSDDSGPAGNELLVLAARRQAL